MNKDRKKKKYSEQLNEIANEFTFSEDVLNSDYEIDDRHLLDDLTVSRFKNDEDIDEDRDKMDKNFEDD